ncbi:hypothetical protein D3C80_1871120 [compost metagenome]
MGQRDSGIGSTARGRGDAGHHLEGNAVGRQLLDLLAATPEDERVAALQAQHALAQLGLLDQQAVDFILGHGMVGAALADVDALGIATAQLDYRRRYETVV